MLSPEYAAGFFDGEGCLNIECCKANGNFQIRASISNTHLGIIELLQQQFGGSISGPIQRGGNTKPFWSWKVMGMKLTSFLEYIKPFVIVKREHLVVGLNMRITLEAYGKMSPERYALQKALKEEMHVLNKRGK